MNFGTKRSDEVLAELGALVIAGLGTWAAGVGAAVLVVELLEAVGVCVVDAVEGAVAPAQPAKTNASAVVLARDRSAYRRGCLTWTYSTSRPTQGSSDASGHRSRYGTTKTMFVPGRRSLRACP